MSEITAAVLHEVVFFGYEKDTVEKNDSCETYKELKELPELSDEDRDILEAAEEWIEEDVVKSYNELIKFWKAYKKFDLS